MTTKITGRSKGVNLMGCTFNPKIARSKSSNIKNHVLQVVKATLNWSLVIIISIIAEQANAQQNNEFLFKQNQFRIGIGATYLKTLDFQYSPNMFQSIRTNVELGYTKTKEKSVFSTDLQVFVGDLKPTSGPPLDFYIKETDIDGSENIILNTVGLSQIGFNLNIGYLLKLSKQASNKTAFYLGGSLEESLTFTPGFLNIGTMNYGSLNARARFDYLLGNGKPLIFEFSAPIVSVVTRMPYHNAPNIPGKSGLAGFFIDNNHVETLNHFQNLQFSIKYPLWVKKKFALDVHFATSWLHYFRPEQFTQAASQLSIGINF